MAMGAFSVLDPLGACPWHDLQKALPRAFSFEERKHMKEDKNTKFDFSWFYFLGTVLVILKALNLTVIPWLWVLSPFWIPWALVLGLMFLALIVIGFCESFSWIGGLWRKHKLKKAMKKAGAL